MRIGPGIEKGTQLGPLVSERQLQRVSRLRAARASTKARRSWPAARATARAAGSISRRFSPALGASARVVQEEIFGPVLVATPFDDVDEIAALANDTAYGLSASIWSNDLKRVHRLIPRIKAGTVWVNCHGLLDNALPFGGYKQSGIGREMGRAMIDLYTETKSVLMMQ